jgi:hypothetical protein
LWDLEADPGEKKNVIDDPKHQKQLAELRRDMHGFFQRFGAPDIEDWQRTTKQKLQTYKRKDGTVGP